MEKSRLAPRLIAVWCLILLAGTVYLFIGITSEGLWYDESYTGCIVKQPIAQIIEITGSDSHPPLYYIMLRLFTLIFRNTVLSLRVFSVLGILALAAWGIGPVRRITGVKTGMLYTILVFITPISLDMAQEARMYSWAAFAVTGSALYGCLAFRDGRKRDWALFSLCSLAAAYTHYYALLAVVIICGLLLLFILFGRKSPKPFLIATGTIVLGYLPWLTKLISQAGRVSDRFWIPPVTLNTLWLVLVYPFSSKFSNPFSPVLTDIAYIAALLFMVKGIMHENRNKDTGPKMPVIAAGTYLLTIFAGALASWIIRPVLVERYMIPVLGLFILGVACGVSSLKGKLRPAAACALLLAISVPQIYYIYTTPSNGPMKEAQASLIQQLQPEDIFIHTDEHTFGSFCYYFPDNRHYYYQRKGYEGYSNYDAFKPNGVTIDSIDQVEQHSRVWLVQRTGANDSISVYEWLSGGIFVADTPMAFYQNPASWYGFSVCRTTPGDPETIAAMASGRDNENKLTLRAGPFKSDNGKALIVLFNQAPMDGPGISYQNLDIVNGMVEAVFYNLPYGEYAALVIHDENLNQTLDFNGNIPGEGFGASNKDSHVQGPPVFDECKFMYDAGQDYVYIPVFYY